MNVTEKNIEKQEENSFQYFLEEINQNKFDVKEEVNKKEIQSNRNKDKEIKEYKQESFEKNNSFILSYEKEMEEDKNKPKLSIKSILDKEEILRIISTINPKKTILNDFDLDNRINLVLFNEENQKILFSNFSLFTSDLHNKLIVLFTKYPNKIFKKPISLKLLIQYYEMTSDKYRMQLIETFDFHVISSLPALLRNIRVFLNKLKSNTERLIIYNKLVSLDNETLESIILNQRTCYYIEYIISNFLTINEVYNLSLRNKENVLINFIMKKFVYYGINNNSTFVVQSLIRNFFNKTIYSYLMNNVQELTEHKNGIFIYCEVVTSQKIELYDKVKILKKVILNSENLLLFKDGLKIIEKIMETYPWAIEYFYDNYKYNLFGKPFFIFLFFNHRFTYFFKLFSIFFGKNFKRNRNETFRKIFIYLQFNFS